MKNWAMDWTDKRLKELEGRIAEAYKTAEKEITAKMQAYLDRFAKQDAVMLAKYKNGEITKAELTEWRTNHFMMGKNWQAVKDSIAGDILKTDAISAGIVNNALIDVYTQNANYAYYELEQGTGTGLSFNLYDRNAVENLLKDNPDFMPHYEPKTPIVERWNKQHITSEMLQGIIQGESIPKIANRMATVVGMERNSAIRNARTYTTSVENKAKMDRYEEAEEMGIDLEKEWMATLDERTRESHRELDGERVANDEPFSNGLMYPADPSGDPAEVYNCRCRIVPRIKGRQYDRSGRASKLGDMSYEEWKRGKEKEEAKGGIKFGNLDTMMNDTLRDASKEYSERMDANSINKFNEIFSDAKFKDSENGSHYIPNENTVAIDANNASGTTAFHEGTHWLDYNQDYTITEDYGKYKWIIDENGDLTGEKEWVSDIVTIKENAGFSEYIAHEWDRDTFDHEKRVWNDSGAKQDIKNFVNTIGLSDTYGNDRSPEDLHNDMQAVAKYLNDRNISRTDPDFVHLSDFMSAISYDATLGSLTTGGHSYDYWVSNNSNRVAEITAGYNLLKATGRNDLIAIEKELAPNLMGLIEKEWGKIW